MAAAKRQATRFARSAHFVAGELTRRVQTALRKTEGRAITADEIAVQAMREKGLDLGDGELRHRVAEAELRLLRHEMLVGRMKMQGQDALSPGASVLPKHMQDSLRECQRRLDRELAKPQPSHAASVAQKVLRRSCLAGSRVLRARPLRERAPESSTVPASKPSAE